MKTFRCFLVLGCFVPWVSCFVLQKSPITPTASTWTSVSSPMVLGAKPTQESATEEAMRLLEKSRALREEIAQQEQERASQRPSTPGSDSSKDSMHSSNQLQSTKSAQINKWAVPNSSVDDDDDSSSPGVEYRLYVDIGREEGTWMEPRWGASGRRIEFTLDVRFQPNQLANMQATQKMVKDNQGGKSSPVQHLESAPLARLRSGFEEMKCQGGSFRIDYSCRPGQSDTLRFFLMVEGITDGDVSIPQGALYFSIPCFGSVAQMSSKGEMPVTVRQMGWHTGFRREESRILGIFKAVPIDGARRKDGF
ncbi:expressed unknown protein [Seminavis robusta]|uniref:Uncharacterized protein n=1 Tax=Seminavis robusta TaxID=568900 RepID=A0A9N8DSI5_9STRA|nr:expressed unknown protein [Seminavis robusta]|eukprot:Sro219_g090550.2  (308) ;mRNA; r:67933-68856